MQAQIEGLVRDNGILKEEKKLNIGSIEEIVGDNNNYKKMVDEMRNMNEILKMERNRVVGENESLGMERDRIKGEESDGNGKMRGEIGDLRKLNEKLFGRNEVLMREKMELDEKRLELEVLVKGAVASREMQSRVQEVQAKFDKLNAESEKVGFGLAKAEERVAQVEAENSKLRQAVRDLQTQTNELSNRNTESLKEISKLTTKILVLEGEVQEVGSQNQELESVQAELMLIKGYLIKEIEQMSGAGFSLPDFEDNFYRKY